MEPASLSKSPKAKKGDKLWAVASSLPPWTIWGAETWCSQLLFQLITPYNNPVFSLKKTKNFYPSKPAAETGCPNMFLAVNLTHRLCEAHESNALILWIWEVNCSTHLYKPFWALSRKSLQVFISQFLKELELLLLAQIAVKKGAWFAMSALAHQVAEG